MLYSQVNPFLLKEKVAQVHQQTVGSFKPRSQPATSYQAFHTASCDFFNRIEALLRRVLKCSQRAPFFRLGERCLDGIWSRYSDLIVHQFTESQLQTLVLLTQDIVAENAYADLKRYRPGQPPSHLSSEVKLIDLNHSKFNDSIKSIMLNVYAFEQQEQRLYLESGAKTRLEPYLLSLFWSQVDDGPPIYAQLLLKWWARLHFVLGSDSRPPAKGPSPPQASGYYFQDHFNNSSQERAIQYLFTHYLQKDGVIRPLNFNCAPKKDSKANSVRCSAIELKDAVKLVHQFFYHLLFDFDIRKVVNAVPINDDGLHKIYQANLKAS